MGHAGIFMVSVLSLFLKAPSGTARYDHIIRENGGEKKLPYHFTSNVLNQEQMTTIKAIIFKSH